MKYARFYNPIVSFLIRLGLPMGPQALLTVPGRKTGLPRTTPVALNPNGVGWRLISVYGRVDWVKNLQAAGTAVVTMRGRKVPVSSRELTVEQAAPILRNSLTSVGPIVRLVPVFILTPTQPASGAEMSTYGSTSPRQNER